MYALSLSHLTYCDRTTTIRSFHSLDRPPFPCISNLSPTAQQVKSRRLNRVKNDDAPQGILIAFV